MSYFSRITLEATNHEKQRRLHQLRTQPYAQHQALWQLFERPAGSTQPFLFRALSDESPRRLQLFLVSQELPRNAGDNWRVESKPYEPKLVEGDRFRFTVRLNPTRAEHTTDRRGKRQDFVISRLHQLGIPKHERAKQRQRIIHEELPNWLRIRGAKHGFEIHLGDCGVERYEMWRLQKGEHDITLSCADFSGVLRVTDASLLEQTLHRGLGHGRSFGMGLLMLKPAHI